MLGAGVHGILTADCACLVCCWLSALCLPAEGADTAWRAAASRCHCTRGWEVFILTAVALLRSGSLPDDLPVPVL